MSVFSIVNVSKSVERLIKASKLPLHSSFLKREFHRRQMFAGFYGVVFYECCFNVWVVAGEPIPKQQESIGLLFEEFCAEAGKQKKLVCGYYISEHFSKYLDIAKVGFKKVPIGASSLIDLKKFSIHGYRRRDLRRALNHGRRDKLKFIELDSINKRQVKDKIEKVYEKWIETKKGPKIQFLLSPPNILSKGRFFVVMENDEIAAFASFYSYENGKNYYLDDMIQVPGAQRFALDFLLSKVLLQMKEEEVGEVSLGLNLFSVRDKEDSDKFSFGLYTVKAFLWAAKTLQWPYRNKGLMAYKRKFNGKEHTRYMFLIAKGSLVRQFLSIFLVTYGFFEKDVLGCKVARENA